jgi:hypothetical protein
MTKCESICCNHCVHGTFRHDVGQVLCTLSTALTDPTDRCEQYHCPLCDGALALDAVLLPREEES